jgi:hypothetical protein
MFGNQVWNWSQGFGFSKEPPNQNRDLGFFQELDWNSGLIKTLFLF